MPSFIIVGYVRQILGRGDRKPPCHLWAGPKKPILNRVNIRFRERNLYIFLGSTVNLTLEMWEIGLEIRVSKCTLRANFSELIILIPKAFYCSWCACIRIPLRSLQILQTWLRPLKKLRVFIMKRTLFFINC